MTVAVHSGDLIDFLGDSLTQSRVWFDPIGGLLDRIDAPLRKIQATHGPNFIAGTPGPDFIAGVNRGFSYINRGQNGDTILNLATPAQVQARVLAFNPQVVVILAGVNDLLLSPTATIIAAMDSWLNQVRTALPTAQIGVVGIICDGEQWVNDPVPFFFNDAKRYAVNAGYAASCVTYGATYIDLTTPLVTTWEPIHNPPVVIPPLPSGVVFPAFTTDGVHLVEPSSAVLCGQWASPYFNPIP